VADDLSRRQGWIASTKSGLTWYDDMAPQHPEIVV
jgi:hypothetical protein